MNSPSSSKGLLPTLSKGLFTTCCSEPFDIVKRFVFNMPLWTFRLCQKVYHSYAFINLSTSSRGLPFITFVNLSTLSKGLSLLGHCRDVLFILCYLLSVAFFIAPFDTVERCPESALTVLKRLLWSEI